MDSARESVVKQTDHNVKDEVSEGDSWSSRDRNGDDPSISPVSPAQQDKQDNDEHDTDMSDESQRRESSVPVETLKPRPPTLSDGPTPSTEPLKEDDDRSDDRPSDRETAPQGSEGEYTESTTRDQYQKELLEQRERLLALQQAERLQQEQQQNSQGHGLSGSGRDRQELVEQREQLLRQQQMEQQQQQQEEEDEDIDNIDQHGSNDDEAVEEMEGVVSQQRSVHGVREEEDRGIPSQDHSSRTDKYSVHNSYDPTTENRDLSNEDSSETDEASDGGGSEEEEVQLKQSTGVDPGSKDEGLPGKRVEREEEKEEEVGIAEGSCVEESTEDCPPEVKNGI